MKQNIDPILDAYKNTGGINEFNGQSLPAKDSVKAILEQIRHILFPGYFEVLSTDTPFETQIQNKIDTLQTTLENEIKKSLLCQTDTNNSESTAKNTSQAFLDYIPELKTLLKSDITATYEGDPAAKSEHEIILSYPGFYAISIYRIAHFFYQKDIPLIPRIMTEIAHGESGIDIHPGAKIGPSFCIDHGTGIVIGETTDIGSNVKLYQGVTLGALSVKKSESQSKRHPTIEDNVTIYARTTILGGETIIGKNSIIGGNVWLTKSLPENSKIYVSIDDKKQIIKTQNPS